MSGKKFEELLQSHRGIVYKVAHTYCWQADDRDDLVQEIAAQLWRAWPSYDAERKFTTWMYRIALNVAIDFVRKDVRRQRHMVPLDELAHDVAGPDAGDSEMEERLRLLQRFIGRQEPLDRALLLLYLEEKSQRDIAEVLGITQTNISTKIARLKQKMRDAMQPRAKGASGK